MSHTRKQIRDAFKAQLAGISGVAGVHGPRAHPFTEKQLPAIVVMTSGEAISLHSEDTEEAERALTVDALIYLTGNAGADDEIDAFAVEVENRIIRATGAPWDNLIAHRPENFAFSFDEGAENTLFAARVRFSVRYSTTDAETIG